MHTTTQSGGQSGGQSGVTFFTAPCQVCGTHLYSTQSGMVWQYCRKCGRSDLLLMTQVASPALCPVICPRCTWYADAVDAQSQGRQGAWGECIYCGYTYATDPRAVLPAATTPTPTTVPVVTPPLTPAPSNDARDDARDRQAMELLTAIKADARLYGAEIAAALVNLVPDARQEAVQMPLALAWERYQQAQAALFTCLGERHMGDYPPDMEMVTRALEQVGVWQILLLQVVGRMNDAHGVE